MTLGKLSSGISDILVLFRQVIDLLSRISVHVVILIMGRHISSAYPFS